MDANTTEALIAALVNATVNGANATSTPPVRTPSAVPLASGVGPAVPNATQSAGVSDAFLRSYQHKMYLLQVFILMGYSIMSILCFVLIVYLRHNRNVALKGDASAARKVLLPAFEPLIWILGITTLVSSMVVVLTMALDAFKNTVSTAASEGFYCGRMFVLLTVVVYMMQKSVTMPALIRTISITLVGALYTLPVEMLLTYYTQDTAAYKTFRHVTLTTARCLLLIFFTYVFVKPPGRASKRSLREYIGFVYGYYFLVLTYNQLLFNGRLDEGFIMVYVTILWASLAPLFMWRVLTADTQHWRGMGQRAVALQSLFRQKNNLNERVSSQGLHVLIEMHRKFIIDFAYLELKNKIGMGSSAVVFSGVLNSKTPVAIKVYTPSEFDENTVAEFSQEAALCGALNHPNIVKFHGMCVCPPTICLVSELCQGSLDDVTAAVANSLQHSHRQQQLINVTYMLDAARAVAYIHSFSPAFVHRDIKPSNFLVDAQNTVKLTDFGESRSLPKNQMMTPPMNVNGSVWNGSSSFMNTKNLLMKSGATLRQETGRQSSVVSDQPIKMTVKGTVDYMAPEIIQGRAGVAQYGEAADVYSLAITMWDILNPGKEKFPTIRNNHLHIFESVVEGKRPELDLVVHATLRDVIESAWHSEPRMRPSAQAIVGILESVQEELFAVFASDLSDELEQDMMATKPGELQAKTFTAHQATERMQDLSFVNTTAEALRLGNALMDAGLLHHAKHERPFETGEGLYFFDEDNINLCQPMLGGDEDDRHQDTEDIDEDECIDHVVPLPVNGSSIFNFRTSSGRASRRAKGQSRRKNSSAHSAAPANGRTTTSAARSEMTTVYDNGICPCRKLGQRLEQPKTGAGSKRRFRRHRQKAASEENILTAKLLGAEMHTVPLANHDFDDFESVATNFQQHHDQEGGLA